MANKFNLCDLIDDIRNGFRPSVAEVRAAKEIFWKELTRTYDPRYTSPETAIASAVAKVWTAGRKYQHEKETEKMPHAALPTPHEARPEEKLKNRNRAR